MEKLINLKTLDLSNNPIEKLPPWITNFNMEIKWIKNFNPGAISFYANPLKYPPVEIVKQGKEAVKNYFKSFKNEKKLKLNQVKVLLVGEGMAGKTSLLKSLQGLKFDKKESQTHGINVAPLNANNIKGMEKNDKIKETILNFWDFGGQEIMHASHQFFMSERSLYILVLDSRTDGKKYHWLEHIEKFGGDSPIIVCMNKIDENKNYNIEQNKINERFPNIENRFHRISCKTKKGIKELITCIQETIPQTSLFGTEISQKWMSIKNQLVKETKENQYLSCERFINICKENRENNKSMQLTLLQYLNDLGLALYFKQLNLSDIYVLDPHWVTIGVYKIINSGKIKKGILKIEDLDYILNKEEIKTDEYDPAKEKNIKYNNNEWRYILSIMEQFELCYEYNKEKTDYIIPNALPPEPAKKYELGENKLLIFIIKYDYLPLSIISRLMIKLKNNILKGEEWKYGMILYNKEHNCKAEIIADENKKSIRIKIKGEKRNKQRYLSVIRSHIRDINEDFKKIKIKEFIPLTGRPDNLVEYKELLGYEKENKEEYFSGTLGEYFSVSEMLDSVISKKNRQKDMPNNININVKQENNQTVTQRQTVNITINQNIQDAKSLFENLKDDIFDEIDIELDDEKAQKRAKKELEKVEKTLSKIETAAREDKKADAGIKDRMNGFINSLSDENSNISKSIKSAVKIKDGFQKFGKVYNKIAPFMVLPSIPDIFLGDK
jgi:small GTP-binding protein